MRYWWFAMIFALVMPLLIPHEATASTRCGEQGYMMRTAKLAAELYHHDHGRYPATDAQSTWYQKLSDKSSDFTVFGTTAGGKYPLDMYGHPLVYEPPSSANGQQIVIRSVGKNGIDEHGRADDWDIRYGPNLGYWYKTDWPAARRRADLWHAGIGRCHPHRLARQALALAHCPCLPLHRPAGSGCAALGV